MNSAMARSVVALSTLLAAACLSPSAWAEAAKAPPTLEGRATKIKAPLHFKRRPSP